MYGLAGRPQEPTQLHTYIMTYFANGKLLVTWVEVFSKLVVYGDVVKPDI